MKFIEKALPRGVLEGRFNKGGTKIFQREGGNLKA